MKKLALGLTAILFTLTNSAQAAQKATKKTAPAPAPVAAPTPPPLSPQAAAQLQAALRLVQAGQFQQAVPTLYTLSRRPEFARERMQIKYILGSALMELGLNQVAAFQFVEVIKNGNSRYVKQAIEKLSLAADTLGDDTLLNYAVSRIRVEDVPDNGKDLIYFRLGEIKQKNGQFQQAIDVFSRVPDSSRYAFLARYNKGMAFLEMNRVQDGVNVFKDLVRSKSTSPVTDTNRVIAELGLARAYYQATDWENSLAMYREIPRDHVLWHDALFESSWAMLRSARFRSVLSNFQSLHSAFYEDFYIPESLLLRSIVYLYICKYDEMEKVLGLFEKTYGPLRSQITNYMLANSDPVSYFNEIEAANNQQNGHPTAKLHMPSKVDFHILREGDVKRAFSYLHALNAEKNRLDNLPNINASPMGATARKILGNRYKNAKISIGEMVKVHLLDTKADLKDLYEQAEFIRYEMINGEKEQLKKRMAGKDIPNVMVNDKVDRDMYVQNGYEYWPFDGENWLDEIGNYHYLGKQNCE